MALFEAYVLEWITDTPSIYGGGKQTDLNMAHMDNTAV